MKKRREKPQQNFYCLLKEAFDMKKPQPTLSDLKRRSSGSGGCHSSHTHKNALAHRTGFRSAVNGGGNRDRRGRPGNTPPFPQSRPRAGRRCLGVSRGGNR